MKAQTAQPAEEATPDLLYSEAEDDLRTAVRALLADRADAASTLARVESDVPCDPELWRALGAGMDLAGLLVPEELGGQGASHREAAVVLEETGRAVAPVPFLTSSVIATETLMALGPEKGTQVAALLGELASGHRTAALVVPFAAGPRSVRLLVTPAGTVSAVADAATADVLIVPTEQGLYAVDAADATIAPLIPLDLTRPLATVTLDGASGTLLAGGDAAPGAVRRGLLAGAGLLASEQLGVAEWCLAETVAYTRERKQFNRPVGSFQALKHRMAQLWLEVVSARAAARNAADALASGSPEVPLAVALAQAYCARVAVRAAEECVQLHGGIGMTWEHPAHLYLKRAKSAQIALGSAGEHRSAIAELADLRAP
ncbi:acyl-CoA dehydrogenase family protein [Streptomyces sp. NPDC006704]|uniref:acyl-CoA dehydrogenase family protein n=1 Tax=Streptomyces sp. NPDC006704 TaxID=3364760 RepID=UPI0036A3B4DA